MLRKAQFFKPHRSYEVKKKISLLFVSLLFLSAPSVWARSSISVVEVPGNQLSNFVGKEVSKMSLRVFQAGQWKAIPFQIDEKAPDKVSRVRRWALDQALSRRIDLPVPDGKLDEDEVLLFMVKDGGEKTNPAGLATQVAELGAGGLYFYLFFEPKQEMKSNQSYVRYNAAQDKIEALGYQNRFNVDHAVIQEELIPNNQAAGNPTNILDRFKVRMILALKSFFDLEIEEENITSRRVGYKAGPIRLIRRIVAYKSLGPIRITPKAESDFLFYPYSIQIPTRIDNPIDGRKSLDPKSKGFAGFDFTKFFYGSQFYAERNSAPMVIDGSMSNEEKNLKTQNVTWWVSTGQKGSLIVKIDWDPALVKAGLTCNLYYVDDRNSLKPPEMDPGEAMVGFDLDLANMPAGHYMIYVTQIFPPPPFARGQEAELIREATRSPAITIQSF